MFAGSDVSIVETVPETIEKFGLVGIIIGTCGAAGAVILAGTLGAAAGGSGFFSSAENAGKLITMQKITIKNKAKNFSSLFIIPPYFSNNHIIIGMACQ